MPTRSEIGVGERGAFAHSDESKASDGRPCLGGIESDPVVFHDERDVLVRVLEDDIHTFRSRVLDDIVERFLRETVNRRLCFQWQAPSVGRVI